MANNMARSMDFFFECDTNKKTTCGQNFEKLEKKVKAFKFFGMYLLSLKKVKTKPK